MNDSVNHPAHYGGDGPYETIRVIEAWDPQVAYGFCVGNAIKYLSRAGKKSRDTQVEDLLKAEWYAGRAAEIIRETRALDAMDVKLKKESEDYAPFYQDRDGDLWARTNHFGGGWYLRVAGGIDRGELPALATYVHDLEAVERVNGPLLPVFELPEED